MVEIHALAAEPKDGVGKGAARAARRAGRVPAIIYGNKSDPVMITLDPRDLGRQINSGSFFATLFDVDVAGKKERVLPRDVQVHPVSDIPIHVDFQRVTGATEVTLEVPVRFTNDEDVPGIRRGGLLNVVRYQVEVICRADAIPNEFEIDLGALELDIGDSVHASHLSLPPGVSLTITDRDFTIATIAAPTVVRDEEAEAAAEGEEGEALLEGVEGEEPTEEKPEGEESGKE